MVEYHGGFPWSVPARRGPISDAAGRTVAVARKSLRETPVAGLLAFRVASS